MDSHVVYVLTLSLTTVYCSFLLQPVNGLLRHTGKTLIAASFRT